MIERIVVVIVVVHVVIVVGFHTGRVASTGD